MRFKVDENLPVEAARSLRESGHEADTVDDQGLAGTLDANLAERCRAESRVLITLDTDFANIRRYPPAEFGGFVVLRLRRQDRDYVLAALHRLVPRLAMLDLAGHLCIVEDDRIRLRED